MLPVHRGLATLAAFAICSHSSSGSIAVAECVKWCHGQIPTATPAHTEPSLLQSQETFPLSSLGCVGHP